MKIVVLGGGLTVERDVSLSSSAGICAALREQGHQAVMVDLFLGVEEWIEDINAYFAAEHPFTAGVREQAPTLAEIRAMRRDLSASHIGPQVIRLCQAADIVFLGLHGADGEDGKIQAAFDLLGIKYTGSDTRSSVLAMDKSLAKLIFQANGIRVPEGILLEKGAPLPADIPFPCVVKPCSGGSSVGTSLVEQPEALPAALDAVFACDDRVLIERYIRGREFCVALLGDTALPVIELDYDSAIFDYFVKYQAGACREICPAPIEEELAERLQETALRAYHALGLSVYSRVDFIVTEEGEIYTLEVNTLPGMTPNSIIPREAAVAGISYPLLCERIVELSLQRCAEAQAWKN